MESHTIDFKQLAYQDFFVIHLLPDETYATVDITSEKLASLFNNTDVWLIIRQDLKRLFLWQGPTSPVRMRFMATQTARDFKSKLRDNNGRDLKIVPVTAGDEPQEFLSAFSLESYQVSEKLEEMQSLRKKGKHEINPYLKSIQPKEKDIAELDKEEMTAIKGADHKLPTKVYKMNRIPTLEEIKRKNAEKIAAEDHTPESSEKSEADELDTMKKRFATGQMDKRLLVRNMMNILTDGVDVETRNKEYLKPKGEQVD